MKCHIRPRDIVFLQMWSLTRLSCVLPALVPGGLAGAWLLAGSSAFGDSSPVMSVTFLIVGFGGGGLLVLMASLPLVFVGAMLFAVITRALGEKEIVADIEGFSENDHGKSMRLPWSKVESVLRSSRYILVRVSFFKYSIIPKRDFPGESGFLLYYARLVTLWTEGRTGERGLAK